MSQIKDMYRMVLIVQERANELEKEREKLNTKESIAHILNNLGPKIHDVEEKYCSKYNCTRTKANAVYSDAVVGKYLKELKKKIGKYNLPYFVSVTSEGRNLTNKDFAMPTGRWNIWLSQNSSLTSFLTGSLFTLLLGFIIWLVKLSWSELHKLFSL